MFAPQSRCNLMIEELPLFLTLHAGTVGQQKKNGHVRVISMAL